VFFQDMSLAQSMMWFFFGVVSYKFLTIFLSFIELSNFAKFVNRMALVVLGEALEQYYFSKEAKLKALADSGVTQKELKKIRDDEEALMDKWKRTMVDCIVHAYPDRYHFLLEFKNYEEAMQILTKIHKK
tara:strand:+ start:726 stop:1115 length:390 start_codon:yes stop_codon:yes gene_type:complete